MPREGTGSICLALVSRGEERGVFEQKPTWPGGSFQPCILKEIRHSSSFSLLCPQEVQRELPDPALGICVSLGLSLPSRTRGSCLFSQSPCPQAGNQGWDVQHQGSRALHP